MSYIKAITNLLLEFCKTASTSLKYSAERDLDPTLFEMPEIKVVCYI